MNGVQQHVTGQVRNSSIVCSFFYFSVVPISTLGRRERGGEDGTPGKPRFSRMDLASEAVHGIEE